MREHKLQPGAERILMQWYVRWNLLCWTSHQLCCIRIVLSLQFIKIYTKCYDNLMMATVPQLLPVEPKTQVSAPLREIRNAIMPGISLHLFRELSEVRSYAEYAGLQTANLHYSTHTVLSQLSGEWKLQLTTEKPST